MTNKLAQNLIEYRDYWVYGKVVTGEFGNASTVKIVVKVYKYKPTAFSLFQNEPERVFTKSVARPFDDEFEEMLKEAKEVIDKHHGSRISALDTTAKKFEDVFDE